MEKKNLKYKGKNIRIKTDLPYKKSRIKYLNNLMEEALNKSTSWQISHLDGGEE